MTQEQALAELRLAFPDRANRITLEYTHSIGYAHGYMDEFYIWDHSDIRPRILASSHTSWDDAVAHAKEAEPVEA